MKLAGRRAPTRVPTQWAAAAVAALLALPGSAMADPSILPGISGKGVTPDATVIPNKCLVAGYSFFETSGIGAGDLSMLGGGFGIGNRLEVGAFAVNRHIDAPDLVFLNSKYAVLGNEKPVQVAIGGIDLLDDFDRAFYAVATVKIGEQFQTAYLPRSLMASAGWGTGQTIDGFFWNASVNVAEWLQIYGEYTSDDDGFYVDQDVVNAGLKFQFAGLTAQVIALGINHDDSVVGANLSYTYCFGKGHKKHDKDEKDDEEGRESSLKSGKQVALRPLGWTGGLTRAIR